MSELLPCPWCGETPRSTNTNAGWDVVCGNTDCPVEPEAVAFSQAAAEAAWNTRASPASPDSKPTGEGDRLERLEDAMHSIVNWCDAYPLKVFPEPDFAKAAQLLKAGGMTIDAISASNMRHVLEGVRKIADGAIARQRAGGNPP